MKKILLLIMALAIASSAFAIDRLINAPSGDLILDAATGKKVQVKKDMNVTGTITGAVSGNATTATTADKVANTLTRGGYLTGNNFDGSAATTWAVDATTTNTVGKVVARDGSGNFAAGTITAALSGNATTSTTADKVANILTRGNYLTGTNFDGSAAATWAVDATTTNTVSKVVARDASGNFAAGTITATLSGNATTATTADKVANTLTRGTYLTGNNFDGAAATTWTVDATSTNTASKVVARDASGDFAAGTITATHVKTDKITAADGTSPAPGMVPIGGMVMVMPNVTGAWQPPATGVVKDGFMRADGATVNDAGSPMNGQALPNMSASVYPRGSTTSGGTGGANTQASNVAVATQPTFSATGGAVTALGTTNKAISAHAGGAVTNLASTLKAISAHSRSADVALTNGAFNLPAHYHGFSLTAAGQGGGSTNTGAMSANASHTHLYGPNFNAVTVQAGGGATDMWGGYNAPPATPLGGWLTTNATNTDHTHSVPAHTHAASSVSGTVGTGCNGNITGGAGSCTATSNVTVATQPNFSNHSDIDIAHGHGFTQPSNHSDIDIAHSHGFTQPTISRTADVALTNNAVNNEPSYVNVVYVIRIK